VKKRVLVDENLPHALRRHLLNHDAVTAAYAGLAGYRNGELLKAATDAGFDVLVTGDKTLRFEQNLSDLRLALVCLSSPAWRIIKPHVAKIAAAVDVAAPGSFTRVDVGVFSRRTIKGEQEPAP
jgi:hypothetical protein